PRLVIGLLTVHSAGMITAVVIDARSGPPEVEPRFYERALAWDATSAQRDKSRALGWHVAWDGTTGAPGQVGVRLTDAAGKPIDGATCEVEFFHRAHSRERISTVLTPAPGARYLIPVSLKRSGEHEFRLVVRRGTDVFTSIDLAWIRPATLPRGDAP
ncbi:MAG: FixH family protein, partial [Planctomycetota bacterium]